MPDIWIILSITIKLGLYLTILISAGLTLIKFVFRGELVDYPAVNQLRCLVMLAVLFSALHFLIKGAMLSGNWHGMIDIEILKLLWITPSGNALKIRLLGLFVVLAGTFIDKKIHAFSVIGAGISLWSFTLIGHVIEHDNLWLQLILFFHLVSIVFWIGILLPLGYYTRHESMHGIAAKIGHRFGNIATVVIPVLFVMGFMLTWFFVGTFDKLITPYGYTLISKLIFVSALLGLGAANKLRFVPKLRQGDIAAAKHLRQSLALEWLAFALILFITATLTSAVAVPSASLSS